jgi:hypothetical protein
MWSSMMSDPLGELAADPDVISGGGEDFSAFVMSRWPGLARLAFGLTGDRWAAEDIAQATLARAFVAWRRVRRADDPDAYLRRILVNTSNRRFRRRRVAEQPGDPPETAVEGLVEPPMAPVDAIIRRGRGIRLRRAGMAAGGLGVVAIIAAANLLPSPPTPVPQQPPPLPVTVPSSGIAGPDGVFASGAAPGIGFAFVQVPNGIDGLLVGGQESVPAIAVTVCGQPYRLVGLAYRLKHPPRLAAQYAGPSWPKTKRSTEDGSAGWPAVYPLPLISVPPPGVAGPQTDGLWNHARPVSPNPTRALLASGTAWSVELIFGVAGDCYEFTSPGSPGDPQTDVCGPISTPDGPETIMAIPLSYPPAGLKAPTGYALQVSPGTAHLRATASDGSVQLVTPRVVDGRRYAAFVIGTSLRLERLTWLDATGNAFASTTSLPRSGYTQFQP